MFVKIFRRTETYSLFLVFALLTAGALWFAAHIYGPDFAILYRAGRAVWSLQNPYVAEPLFYNPPWAIVFLAPLGALPPFAARTLWLMAGTVGYMLAFSRLRIDAGSAAFLMASPFVIADLSGGNFDWMILLGSTLSPAYGSWVLALKPQVGMVMFILWLKEKNWAVLFPVVTLALLLVLQLYPLPAAGSQVWNRSLFPYSVPFGVALAYLAYKRNDPLLALACAPMLSPYVAFQSWGMALLPLARSKRALAVAVVASWMFVIATK